jgi:hypothetical protein
LVFGGIDLPGSFCTKRLAYLAAAANVRFWRKADSRLIGGECPLSAKADIAAELLSADCG